MRFFGGGAKPQVVRGEGAAERLERAMEADRRAKAPALAERIHAGRGTPADLVLCCGTRRITWRGCGTAAYQPPP